MPTKSDLTDVIDRTALIENILSQVIEAYCEPRKDRFIFFWSVLLDSSIMPMGSKTKVTMAIAQEMKFKLDQNALHSVVSLRNAFAHQPTNSHPVLVVGKTPEESEMHLQLQILSNSGKISMKRRRDALAEFNAAYKIAKVSLVELLNAIKGEHAANAI
jgi:ERCC4-type nuclease